MAVVNFMDKRLVNGFDKAFAVVYDQYREMGHMSGLPRGSLTRELLVRESLRLLDEHGVTGFSLPKLGRALGADPTAIYRHFASKDELILAIADALIEEGLGGIGPSACWV